MLTPMRVLASRFVGLFRRNDFDHAMDEEFQSHLAMLANRFERQGMTRDEALLAAKRQFGGVIHLQEELRERSSLAFVESLWGDARHALRQMRKSPAFTATAVLTLALGIGANTAIYSFMESILLRSLPVADPRIAGGVELAQPPAPERQRAMGPRHARATRHFLAGRETRVVQRDIPIPSIRGASQ